MSRESEMVCRYLRPRHSIATMLRIVVVAAIPDVDVRLVLVFGVESTQDVCRVAHTTGQSETRLRSPLRVALDYRLVESHICSIWPTTTQ